MLSKIKSNKRQGKENISYFAKKFLGEGTGPQEFLTNLIIEINKFKKISSHKTRKKMSRFGKKIIDGKGALRLAKKIKLYAEKNLQK